MADVNQTTKKLADVTRILNAGYSDLSELEKDSHETSKEINVLEQKLKSETERYNTKKREFDSELNKIQAEINRLEEQVRIKEGEHAKIESQMKLTNTGIEKSLNEQRLLEKLLKGEQDKARNLGKK